MKLYTKQTLNDIQREFGFKFTKSLGQNFLMDKNIIEKILAGCHIEPEDTVIEIGPGIGVLTGFAAEQGKKVIAIEIDKHLLPILEKTMASYDNVKIIHGDVLKTDLRKLVDNEKSENGKVCILGNLPYYITTPIIMKILEEQVDVSIITIMMQKEVAQRIGATPSTKEYGSLSVAVQYYCQVEKVTNVPKDVFVPVPKVDSTVLCLKRREKPPVDLYDEKLFFECVKKSFSQRRKTLLNCLTGFRGFTKEEMGKVLEEVNIDSRRRGETLTIDEFASLANRIKESE